MNHLPSKFFLIDNTEFDCFMWLCFRGKICFYFANFCLVCWLKWLFPLPWFRPMLQMIIWWSALGPPPLSPPFSSPSSLFLLPFPRRSAKDSPPTAHLLLLSLPSLIRLSLPRGCQLPPFSLPIFVFFSFLSTVIFFFCKWLNLA